MLGVDDFWSAPDPWGRKWPISIEKRGQISCFVMLGVLFWGLKASPVAWMSFTDKKNCKIWLTKKLRFLFQMLNFTLFCLWIHNPAFFSLCRGLFLYIYSLYTCLHLLPFLPMWDVHCTEIPIYVFLEMKLRGFIPNSYIHVSVSDLYIPRIGLHIWLQQNR